jgi:hypothetical protein
MMYSFYRVADGAIANFWYTGAEPDLNAPAGHVPIAGKLDARRHKVELITDDFGDQHPVVKRQAPPRPADTDERTWTWRQDLDDWVAYPTLALLKTNAREPVLDQLVSLDAQAARPVGEIAEAQALGLPAPAASLARLQSVNADKQALRERMKAIASVESAEALEALLAQPVTLQTSSP